MNAESLPLFDETFMPVSYSGQNSTKPVVSNKAYFALAVALFDVDPIISPNFVSPFYMRLNAIKLGDKALYFQLRDVMTEKERFQTAIYNFDAIMVKYRRWDWINLEQGGYGSMARLYEAFFSVPVTQEDVDNFAAYVSKKKLGAAAQFYNPHLKSNIAQWGDYVSISTNNSGTYRVTELIYNEDIDGAMAILRKSFNIKFKMDVGQYFAEHTEFLTIPFVRQLIKEHFVDFGTLTDYIMRFNLWYLFQIPEMKELFITMFSIKTKDLTPIARNMVSVGK